MSLIPKITPGVILQHLRYFISNTGACVVRLINTGVSNEGNVTTVEFAGTDDIVSYEFPFCRSPLRLNGLPNGVPC